MAYTLGGKPSPGTPKDGRLKQNKPATGGGKKSLPFGGKKAKPFGTKKGK